MVDANVLSVFISSHLPPLLVSAEAKGVIRARMQSPLAIFANIGGVVESIELKVHILRAFG